MKNQTLRETFYKIVEESEDNDLSPSDCHDKIKELFTTALNENHIKSFKTQLDEDVYDSPGLDVYYISVAWIDTNDLLHLEGTSYQMY